MSFTTFKSDLLLIKWLLYTINCAHKTNLLTVQLLCFLNALLYTNYIFEMHFNCQFIYNQAHIMCANLFFRLILKIVNAGIFIFLKTFFLRSQI